MRKTPLRQTQGTRLIQGDEPSENGLNARSTHDRVTTLGPDQPRPLTDAWAALDAVDPDIIASSSAPSVQQSIERGRI
jgi:hypothetical protein